jgi:hypothetical protein
MKVELYSNILPGNTAIDSSGDPYNYTINPCAFTYNDMVYAVIKGSIYEISIDSSHNIAAILFYEHRIDLSDPSSNSHVIYDIAFYNNTIYYSLTYESIGV